MSLRGLIQCRKIKCVYNAGFGDSAGIREFVNTLLPIFQSENPNIPIEVIEKPGVRAHVAADYVNGRSKAICVKKANAEEILRHVENLSTTVGTTRNRWTRIKDYVEHSKSKSIQGSWTIWTFGKDDVGKTKAS